jgi:murein DD-endopeptidase MepM/ murein hydrolase activator NlpD
VVVYAGAISGGYGNMVMVDHGNGYQTLYAHLSKIAVRCGANVGQGGVIGYAGSTGNSTGPHLHFEIRYFGTFVNPWAMLN